MNKNEENAWQGEGDDSCASWM